MAQDTSFLTDTRAERFVLGSLISLGDTKSADFTHRWSVLVGSMSLEDDTIKQAARLFTERSTRAVFMAVVSLVKRHVIHFNTTTLYREIPNDIKGEYVILTQSESEDIYDGMIVLDDLALEGAGSISDFNVHVESIRRARATRDVNSRMEEWREGLANGTFRIEELSDVARELETHASSSRKVRLLSPADSLAMIRASQSTGECVPTGYAGLDQIIGGFEEGRLYIFAGRPGSGKSLANINSAIAALEHGACVLFVSAEVPAREVYSRLLAAIEFVPYKDIWNGVLSMNKTPLGVVKYEADTLPEGLSASVLDSINRAARAEKRLSDNGHFHLAALDQGEVDFMHVKDLIRTAHEHAVEHDVPLVVFIDYIQLLSNGYLGSRRGMNRTEIIGEMSSEFKRMATALSIPIVLSAQLNRDAAAGKPTIAMLRDSGSLEQDADVIVLIDRESQRNEDAKKDEVTFIVGKSRSTGIGEVSLHFIPDKSVITDFGKIKLAQDSGPSPKESYESLPGEDNERESRRRYSDTTHEEAAVPPPRHNRGSAFSYGDDPDDLLEEDPGLDGGFEEDFKPEPLPQRKRKGERREAPNVSADIDDE